MISKMVELKLLEEYDKVAFVEDNQKAFKYGVVKELKEEYFEDGEEVISKKTIENAIQEGTAYRILYNKKIVGGLVVKVKEKQGDLELLFVNPSEHSKGIGLRAWLLVEEMYPRVEIWQTYTPYFEERNIYFYVNKCGFKIVEFYRNFHSAFSCFETQEKKECSEDSLEGMFRFEKIIKKEEV